MAKVLQVGIIDVGAHSVRLDIFEAEKGGGNRLLESLSRSIPLGRDVFGKGAVSSENINLLGAIMREFARKLGEYQVKNVRAVATSAIREAANRELVISRVRNDSGITIELLEEQEEARLYFLSLRETMKRSMDFSSANGIGCILGTGSLIIIFFQQGVLVFCESIPQGTMRFYDELDGRIGSGEQLVEVLQALDIRQRLMESVGEAAGGPVCIAGMGASFRLLSRTMRKKSGSNEPMHLPPTELENMAKKAQEVSPEQIAWKYRVSEDQALGVILSGALLEYFMDNFDCRDFVFPEVTTRSAVLAEMLRQAEGEKGDPFYPDIIASAAVIARKYGVEATHAENVTGNALQIFDKLKMFYDFPANARLLLEIASMLHDVGRFVDARQHHKHSHYIIVNSQIPGVSWREQNMIGAIARYHRKSLPRESHSEYLLLNPEDRVTVLKLAAILRVADALNRLHQEKFHIDQLRIRNGFFVIKTGQEDYEFEENYARIKGDLFAEVYGLELAIEGMAVEL